MAYETKMTDLSDKFQKPFMEVITDHYKYRYVSQSVWVHLLTSQNMINKINKERRRSINATSTRPSNKNQRQGVQTDPKQKRDMAQARTGTLISRDTMNTSVTHFVSLFGCQYI
jgi:transposase